MYRTAGQLLLSPSDLNNFVACRHLTALDLDAANGVVARPDGPADPTAELVARKGDEHEVAYLARVRGEGTNVVEIPRAPSDGLEAQAAATADAMRDGAEVIYQATFLHDGWRGHADFLERLDDRPSDLGDYSYEVLDTKLARSVRPSFILQLSCYSEMVAAVQGVVPQRMHVVLGTGERESFAVEEFAAYYRRVKTRLREAIASDEAPPYPFPVAHCALCAWSERCVAQREADDHPSLVANIRRGQVLKLEADDIATVAALGAADPDDAPQGIGAATWRRLQRQAALQVEERRTGEPLKELVAPVEAGRGFSLLPEPDAGDVFFDLEGDPFENGGLEYLWGWETRDATDPAWTFDAAWAHDAAAERRAFEDFVDLLVARHREHPAMHAYHYAHYEPTALKRLAGAYATREAEVDQLLREGVLVDLFTVVRQGLVISRPGYGLKEVERFYLERREAEVQDAGGSIVAYERWLEERDPAILEEIERYNAEDVESTRRLRDWLLPLRDEALAGGVVERVEREPYVPSDEAEADQAEVDRLRAALLDGVPEEPGAGEPDQEAPRLLAHLLDYHQREARPAWWAYFARFEMTEDELLDDGEALSCLGPDPESPPVAVARSMVRTYRYPPQEFKLGIGDDVCDPLLSEGPRVGKVVALDVDAGTVSIRRGNQRDEELGDPRALAACGPYGTKEQRGALRRVAADVVDGTGGVVNADGRYPALRHLLLRLAPRVDDLESGAPLQGEHVTIEHATDVIGRLRESALMVQGPPGSGKTHTGGRVIAELLRRGARVGVASTSHKAINKLLAEVEDGCDERDITLRGVKKASDDGSAYEDEKKRGLIKNVTSPDAVLASDPNLVGGTAWYFCRADVDQVFDYLFLDEAGQISLADALALGTAARNLVLLGDPQQLAQVSQGVHPPGAGASVLEHVLGDHVTVPPSEGLFLADTFRLHPDVCGFVSAMAYEGRLASAPGATQRDVVGGTAPWTGTGLRFVGVEHDGDRTSSPAEAARVAEIYDALLATSFVDPNDGDAPRRLGPEEDILVVAPYNAQVRCLAAKLPAGARVGTVDKFQGQQAPVTIYSLATSSGDDLPRNLEFLFSRNRLNVAISRAQCLSIVVASPRLLDVDCRTVDQMRLVNELCRLAEVAAPR